MLFWQLCILGVIMGWGDLATAFLKADIESGPPDDPADDTPEIPSFFRANPLRQPSSIPVLEPDDTPLLADAYLRAGGGG